MANPDRGMKIIYQPKGMAREYADWAANLYSGCTNGCAYCYVPGVLRKSAAEFHAKVTPRRGAPLIDLATDCKLLAERQPGARILMSFTCDPLPEIERLVGYTRAAIVAMQHHGLALQLLTKRPRSMFWDWDWPRLSQGDVFGVTITTLDSEKARAIEPGADSPADRLRSLELAKTLGVTTWLSLEPVIDPDDALRVLEASRDCADAIAVGALNHRRSDTDWALFGKHALDKLEEIGKPYYLKQSLRQHMPGYSGAFGSVTDMLDAVMEARDA